MSQTVQGRASDDKLHDIRVDNDGRVVIVDETPGGGSGSTSVVWLIKNTSPPNDPEIATYKYFGYLEDGGTNWRILRKTLATNEYKYATGTSGYAAAWTGKDGLSYT